MPFCSFSKDSAMFDSTSIENMFLLEYLPTAPEGFLRVYLYARMLSLHPELCGSIGDMAKALHMDEDAVYNAFHYWEQQGLVEKLTDRPATYAMRSLRGGTAAVANTDTDVYRYREYNSRLQGFFGSEELLSPRHYEKANDWLNVMGFTQEAALRMLEYMISQPGGRKPDAVFKRANDRAVEWAERGIRTLEDVEKAIAYNESIYSMASAVMKQLAISRKPTANELDCVRRWIYDWKLTEEDVLAACAHTTKARSPSIAYLDAILKAKVDSGEGQHFETVKVILKELGANNIVPTPDQIRTYTTLLEKGFEPETVLLAAVQCARKRKNSFEDLVWMLDNWDKAGVRTRAQADKYVLDMQQATREVRALLEAAGLTRRPTMDDLDRYESWKQKYSMDMILCAAECARGTRVPVRFMEKLLSEWAKSGISTPEAAKAQHAAFKPAGSAATAAKPSHMNYQQRPATDDTYGKNSYSDPTKDLE